MLSLITILNIFFCLFIFYQLGELLIKKNSESFMTIMPVQYKYETQPFFTKTKNVNKPTNTYYRNAKFNIDIEGHSMESETKTNY